MRKKKFRFFFWGKTRKEKIFSLFFMLSMIFKGINGLIELAAGLTFEILPKESLLELFERFLKSEKVFQFPNETIQNWVISASHALNTNLRLFISIILIGNGVIKIILSISLLLRKFIAFPIALIFLVGLYIYQIIQTVYTPTFLLYFLDVFDLFVIAVVWKEYLRLKKERKIFQK